MATAAAQEECRDTKCTICHETFSVPKILPCGHVLCQHCLLSWLQTQQPALCPLCRYPIVEGNLMPSQSYEDLVDAFPTHLLMAAMVEAESLLSKQHVCCVCENVVAVSLCVNCGDMFCQPCTTMHKKLSATKHHQLETLTALTADELAVKRPVTCAVHASELAQAYCPTHTVYVCLLCATTDHRQCPQMVRLEAEVAESHALLKQVAATLKAGEKKLEGGIKEMDKDIKELEKQTDSGLAEIEAVRWRLEKAFEACWLRVKNEMLSTSGDLKEKMREGKAVLVKERGRFSAHAKIVQQVEGFSTHGSFGDMATMMEKRAHSLDCSDDFTESVRVNCNLALTLDPKAVTRIEQELSQFGSVKAVKKVKIEDCKNESEHIDLKVTGQDGSVIHFKIKRNTPLRKLMVAYCKREGIKIGALRFLFDGKRINDENTPETLEMEDGDSIHTFLGLGGTCTTSE